MQIPCFMLSWIVIPSWWILSNHNFVTKFPNPGSLKLPTVNCFLMREVWIGKLFHWQYVFTKIWYSPKQPNKARPKISRCCDEIMLRDEITGLDGITLNIVGRCLPYRFRTSYARYRTVHLKKLFLIWRLRNRVRID